MNSIDLFDLYVLSRTLCLVPNRLMFCVISTRIISNYTYLLAMVYVKFYLETVVLLGWDFSKHLHWPIILVLIGSLNLMHFSSS